MQELAKKEREGSGAKMREAIEILKGDHLRHCRQLVRLLGSDFLGVQILASGKEYASGWPQQVGTDSGASAFSSSSSPVLSVRAQSLLEQGRESTITTSLLPFIVSFKASLPQLFCS